MKTLHELLEAIPDNLIDEQLIDVPYYANERSSNDNDYVYCAVGFMLHESGVTDDDILELAEQEQHEIMTYAASVLGLSWEQVNQLVEANDSGFMTGEERQLKVRQTLLELI